MPRLLGLRFLNRRGERDAVAVRGERNHLTQRRGVAIGALLAVVAAVLAAGRLVRRVEVRGPSMLPTLAEGERLLVRPARRLAPGALVVVRDPADPERLLVKRLRALEGDTVVVEGDNAGASRDSGDFGPVAAGDVLGIAWYRYAPASQAGRLARRR